MAVRLLCLLLALVLLASCAGCYFVHDDYVTFSLSGRYEAWAESEGLLVFYPPLNPFWWFGVLLLAVDIGIAPFTAIRDLVHYLGAEPGTLPAPWALDEAGCWEPTDRP